MSSSKGECPPLVIDNVGQRVTMGAPPPSSFYARSAWPVSFTIRSVRLTNGLTRSGRSDLLQATVERRLRVFLFVSLGALVRPRNP